MDNIEHAIVQALQHSCLSPQACEWSDPEWTSQIKNALAEEGKNRGYWVYASGCAKADEGEWLYDLCWLKYNGYFLTDAELVMESEWDPYGLDDDFQKLLLARARHRLMIFWVGPTTDPKEVAQHLTEQIALCSQTQPGDRYLLAAWHGEVGFQFILYVAGAEKPA
jgi:hypothetical protein